MTQQTRNRKDHFVPQCYLRGFIHPSLMKEPKPLWVFDIESQSWKQKSPAEVGFIRGFYDYSDDSRPDATVDEAVASLERLFPQVRQEIRSSGYYPWNRHRAFLISFAKMLAARSPLFRSQVLKMAENQPMFELVEMVGREPALETLGSFAEVWRLEEFRPKSGFERKRLHKNRAITDMRTAIHSSSWFDQLYWCLRFTENPSDPVIAADQSVVVDGTARTLAQALDDPDTLIFFPISWDMCLVGSRMKFEIETAPFHSADLSRLGAIMRWSANTFLVSPCELAF